MYEFSVEVAKDLADLKAHALTVTVHYRDKYFETVTRSRSLKNYVNS